MVARNRNEVMSEELASLKRIEELVTLIAKTALAERLSEILDDKQHRIVYEEVGQAPIKDLAKRTGLSVGTISRLWQRWERAGLLVKDGKQYRRLL